MAPLLLACTACVGRSAQLFETLPQDADRRGDTGVVSGDGVATPSWGSYLQGVILPACATGASLVVTTAAEEQDGGTSVTDPAQAGPTLSLWEAFAIAENRPGYDAISFDPTVFPPDRSTTIAISGAYNFLQPTEAFCLSGIGAGVALEWSDAIQTECGFCVWSLPPGSLMVGLELRKPRGKFSVNASQVAGCYVETIDTAFEAGLNVLLGPGNVFAGAGTAIRADFQLGLVVRGNFFGFDPRTGRNLYLTQGLVLFIPSLLEENTFGGEVGWTVSYTSTAAGSVVLRNNRWGVAPDGSLLGSSGPHLRAYGNPSRWVIGPGNIIAHSTAEGIVLSSSASDFVEITANSIFDNAGGGIVAYDTSLLPTAPVINTVTDTDVSGTCTDIGRVELFADRGDEGELYLGSVECTAGLWSFAGDVPAGFNATATLTDGQGRTSVFSAPVPAP